MELLQAVKTDDLDRALAAVLAHFACQVGTIHVLEADGQLHLRAHSKGLPDHIVAAARVVPIGKGIAGLAAQHKTAINECNLARSADPRIPDSVKSSGVLGAVCVPMMKGDDVVGTLGVAVLKERDFTQAEEELLTHVARIIASQL
mgnify:CR=1 FL=1